MNKSNQNRSVWPHVGFWCLCGLIVSPVLALGNASVVAQDSFSSSATPTPLTPPTPLEASPSLPATPGSPTPIPPMSIGPTPGFYPPPAYYTLNGRPIYPAPNYYGGPAFGPPPYGMGPRNMAPRYYGPVGPPPAMIPNPGGNPYGANFAPASPFHDQALPQTLSESRRATSPQNPISSAIPTAPAASAGPANFRLTVSKAFLNRLIAREDVKPGPIQDVILGAQVTGQQTTVSKLHLDLVPSTANAHAVFVLNGDVQSLTTGVTPQAAINTVGQQQFVAVKDVFFDGEKLSTRHATVFIRANNKTVGAMTPLTGTLFGGLADRIAYLAAERQKNAGEAAARDRLAEKLFPTFDGEVDAQLSQANRQLNFTVRKQLEDVKLMPTSQCVWTSDSHYYHQGWIGTNGAQASLPQTNDSSDGEQGLQLMVHESLLTTIVDRAGIKGLKTTDKELRALEEPYIPQSQQSTSFSAEPTVGDDNDTQPTLPAGTDTFVTDIVFDDVEPLTLRLEDDRLVVTIKATFKPGGQSLIPPMSVTIPYQTRIVGDKIRLTAGKPRVVTQERADPEAPQTIVESAIEKIIQAELVPLEFDRKLPSALWTANGPPPQITLIKSKNGWATIAVD